MFHIKISSSDDPGCVSDSAVLLWSEAAVTTEHFTLTQEHWDQPQTDPAIIIHSLTPNTINIKKEKINHNVKRVS